MLFSFSGCNIIKRQYSQELIKAIEANDMDTLAQLISEKGDIDAKPYAKYAVDVANHTPLSVAAYEGNFMAVKMLVEAGADVNIAGSNGWTALHMAISSSQHKENFEIAEYLIENGADIHAKDNGGDAAINAMLNANVEDSARLPFFLYLLEQGATLQESESGHILFDACYNDSNLAIIEYVFEHNDIDINMRSNYKNQTLLMQTMYRGADEVCQFLLQKGADSSLMNSDGRTAYDMAIEAYEFAVESGNNERMESFQRIIELLEE
jgi:ankyrin repeat protein